MPIIKFDQLCSLATSHVWQQWLYAYDQGLYNELVDHLRGSKGCGHNREKMKQLVDRIVMRVGGQAALISFLQTNFPVILEEESTDGKLPNMVLNGSVRPFEWDGVQLTFPRRAILENNNPIVLMESVRALITGKIKS